MKNIRKKLKKNGEFTFNVIDYNKFSGFENFESTSFYSLTVFYKKKLSLYFNFA